MIPIILIIGAVIMIIYLRKYQNEERMALIEKGLSADLIQLKNLTNTSFPLRASLLLIGAGIGMLMGHVLESSTDMDAPVAYFSMLFIFGGIGLGVAYIIEEKKAKT
ncbi:hypothetical protein DQQ10_16595 [Pseudochryseolinea flava]|uniref:DUF6249 domain-containing protein n=2 Tax=Pseudochryseolinea flava TaxID=2059302 RepID=A0A364Y246_9BACT|nr:hypothetical protein DQQ10_16595 [Pseudochryseolinea flava]